MLKKSFLVGMSIGSVSVSFMGCGGSSDPTKFAESPPNTQTAFSREPVRYIDDAGINKLKEFSTQSDENIVYRMDLTSTPRIATNKVGYAYMSLSIDGILGRELVYTWDKSAANYFMAGRSLPSSNNGSDNFNVTRNLNSYSKETNLNETSILADFLSRGPISLGFNIRKNSHNIYLTNITGNYNGQTINIPNFDLPSQNKSLEENLFDLLIHVSK